MSGLAALLHRDGRPADPAALWAMLAAIPYRGPDGANVHIQGHVGLGHALNMVTPEDHGVLQPLVSRRTGCVIISDARLDNRAQIAVRLPDRSARRLSDAELILRGYERWGDDVVTRLIGDFAIVIWDPRRERLLCARDPRGQRALFYRSHRQSVAVASEIHQLFQDQAAPIEPDEERIRAYLLPINIHRNEQDDARTFFEGVSAVPAGYLLTVDRDALSVRRYRRLTPPTELRYRRDDEYVEHFLALLCQAVGDRLRSAGPIGVLLSGGLDSSSITCIAQELGLQGKAGDLRLVTYSLIFDELDCDEAELIRTVQEKYDLESRFIRALRGQAGFAPEPSGFLESPNLGARATRDAVFEVAERDGVRVMLSGAIADACVYGSRIVFDSLLRQGKLRAFWRHLRAFRRVSAEPLGTTIAAGCLGPLLPLAVQRHFMAAYMSRLLLRHGRRVVPSWIREPYGSDLVKRNLEQCVRLERERLFSSPARHEEWLLLEPPEVVRHPSPWIVELWHPFADPRLQEFLLAVPPDQKFDPHPETDEFYAGSKWLLRRALRGILPDRIRTRKTKTTFSGWIGEELERQWPTYRRLFESPGVSQVAARGYVDQALFLSRLDELRRGVPRSDQVWLMKVLGLEIWLRSLTLPRDRLTSVPRSDSNVAGRVTRDRHVPAPQLPV
jgi:asparagine synthase (glutamine-hydrolysing)